MARLSTRMGFYILILYSFLIGVKTLIEMVKNGVSYAVLTFPQHLIHTPMSTYKLIQKCKPFIFSATLEAKHAEEIDDLIASNKQQAREHREELKTMEQHLLNETSIKLGELSEAHAEIVLGLQNQIEQSQEDRENLRQEMEAKFTTKILGLNAQIEAMKKGVFF